MNNPMVTVTLADSTMIDCVVKKHTYDKNRKQIALQLYAADTERNRQSGTFPGMPMGKPTVCLPDNDFKENETAIKNCDEYAGFLDALEQAGVVRRTPRTIHGPYLSYPVVDVLI
ncbi:hypothetical protein HC02_11565 [Vibrio parahaemolyticus]|nr:hypothetical protein HC02_11565 [Vibrio parahaemolyticus]